jgi:hypothetical protein
VRRARAGEIRRTLAQRADRTWRYGALWRRAGALDDDPGVRPDTHAFIVDKAPWFAVTDDLPQYPADILGQNAPHDS